MKVMKKLLVTLFTTIILSLSLGNIVYASELETAELKSEQEVVIEGTDRDIEEIDEQQILDESSLTQDSNAQSTETNIEDNRIQSNQRAKDESQMSDHVTKDEAELPEGSMYVDEQGQVYYIEPNEEEIEVEEEDEPEDEVEELPYSEEELRLLTGLIYAEAGNQSYKGMLAVANVVINRADSDVYWHVDSIKEVIYDRKWSVQFSVTIKNKKTGKSLLEKALECYDSDKFPGSNPEEQRKSMKRAIKAAKAALEGENNIGDYLCFRANRNTSSIKKKYDYKVLGDHIFYRTK